MANVLFSRTDSPSTKPITDGQIIFDTSGNGKMYLDNGTTRLEMGGAINVDTTLDANSTNPIQNKGVAGVMLSELEEVRGVTKKGFLTDALATKTLDAKIGTTDISSIGDGTVTGAISDVNGKLRVIDFIIPSTTNLSDTCNVTTDQYGNSILSFSDGSVPTCEDTIMLNGYWSDDKNGCGSANIYAQTYGDKKYRVQLKVANGNALISKSTTIYFTYIQIS